MNSTHAAKRSSSLQEKLQRKISVTWQGQELASAIERLARAGEIDIWIDRRVDRQRKISFEIVELSFEQSFQTICQQYSLGFTRLGEIVYLGPEQTAQQLAALITEARVPAHSLPSSLRKRWEQPKPVEWSRLSEPRQLVQTWLKEANLTLLGGERIPHDLWPQQSLPPMSLVERLVLTLAGFELTCQITNEGRTCKVIPSTNIALPTQPDRRQSSSSPVKKRSAQHSSRQVFTLRLENQPLGKVLDKFAQQLKLQYEWAEALEQQARKQLVFCDVKEANLDELLEAVLNQLKLRHSRQGKRIRIDSRG